MTYRAPVYVGGPDVALYVCSVQHFRWPYQSKCEGALKDPNKDKCWYLTSDGVCKKLEMENEAYQKQLIEGGGPCR